MVWTEIWVVSQRLDRRYGSTEPAERAYFQNPGGNTQATVRPSVILLTHRLLGNSLQADLFILAPGPSKLHELLSNYGNTVMTRINGSSRVTNDVTSVSRHTCLRISKCRRMEIQWSHRNSWFRMSVYDIRGPIKQMSQMLDIWRGSGGKFVWTMSKSDGRKTFIIK